MMAEGKKSILKSRTFWVNAIALAALLLQAATNREVIPVEGQAALLTLVNIVLRLVTKKEIVW